MYDRLATREEERAKARMLREQISALIGLEEAVAHSVCARAGVLCRTVKRDGQGLMKTNDSKMLRANLYVKNGVVYIATVG